MRRMRLDKIASADLDYFRILCVTGGNLPGLALQYFAAFSHWQFAKFFASRFFLVRCGLHDLLL